MPYVNLTNEQIGHMAEVATDSYEMSGEWGSAYRAAAEYSLDYLGGPARPSAVKLAVRQAQVRWQHRVMSVKRALGDFDDMGCRKSEAHYHYEQKRRQGRF